MDNAECAARILARAFGYGQAWEARLVNVPADDSPALAPDGLAVCHEAKTLERTGDSVSVWLGRQGAQDWQLTPEQRQARATLPPEERERLWAWERANPLAKGQQANPYRPREFDRWVSAKAVQIMRPLNAMDTCALEALAGIPKPLQATLLLYALQDGRHWPTVETYARATLPASAHVGIPEGMFRLLVGRSVDSRARALKMRRADYVEMTTPALHLFEDWLQRASETFLAALDRPPPPAGSQGNAHTTQEWLRPPEMPAPVRLLEGLSAHVRGPPPTSPKHH